MLVKEVRSPLWGRPHYNKTFLGLDYNSIGRRMAGNVDAGPYYKIIFNTKRKVQKYDFSSFQSTSDLF